MHLNFIKDKEINIEDNDLIGAKPYVETLQHIIETCDTPFTIGLLGGWGVGKSFITHTIKIGCQNATHTNIIAFRVGNQSQIIHVPSFKKGISRGDLWR